MLKRPASAWLNALPRRATHSALFGTSAEASEIKASLRSTLGLDPGAFVAFLTSMAHDEVAMRLRYYWGSTVASTSPGEPPDMIRDTEGVTAEITARTSRSALR